MQGVSKARVFGYKIDFRNVDASTLVSRVPDANYVRQTLIAKVVLSGALGNTATLTQTWKL